MTEEANPMTFDEIVEAITHEDHYLLTGVGALVRIALGADEPEWYAEAASALGYREFHLLACIFASFGTTVLADRYDALLDALVDADLQARREGGA